VPLQVLNETGHNGAALQTVSLLVVMYTLKGEFPEKVLLVKRASS
jgi:hypothetical protein